MPAQKTSQAAKAKDLLSSLTASKKPTPKAAQKPSKPKMNMTAEVTQTFNRFVDAYSLAKDVDARRDNEKRMLNSACTDQWVEQLWKTKNRPATQNLRTATTDGKPDHSANFIVADKYTFNVPEREEDESLEDAFVRKFIELFVATGMSVNDAKDAACNFVLNEMDLKPRPSIDLFRWLEGHYEGEGENKVFVEATAEEKELGIKIVTLLQGRGKQSVFLTDEEYGQVFELKEFIQVKKGFLQRACSYIKTLDQLKAIFTVVKPIVWPGQVEFAISSTPEERNKRKLATSHDILGIQQE